MAGPPQEGNPGASEPGPSTVPALGMAALECPGSGTVALPWRERTEGWGLSVSLVKVAWTPQS